MIRMGRRRIHTEPIRWAGRSVRLESTEWWLRLGGDRFGWAASYHHPSAVRTEDEGDIRIVDHVMLTRMAALLAAAIPTGKARER